MNATICECRERNVDGSSALVVCVKQNADIDKNRAADRWKDAEGTKLFFRAKAAKKNRYVPSEFYHHFGFVIPRVPI